MDSTKSGYVTTNTINGVAQIEFFHPAHNSLPSNLLRQLTDAIQVAGQNDAIKVVVLKSGGEKTFCAGASFDELVAINTFETGKAFFMGFADVINAIRQCPKFVVGRIHGKAVGGGVGIAAACDYSMATLYASIKLSEMAVGFGPFVIGPAVERKMGLSAFSHLSINATEWQTAKWAKEKGLFMEVFDTTEQLDEYLKVFTSRLAATNPEAMALLKKTFWHDTDHWNTLLNERAAISGSLALSDFTRQAIAAFKQKA
ncbi:MAG: enoyl-CoA hydratase/isomerase family protein [Saprospiraceae bacterium]|nr:enoyl-CoA hydratase/isomerase family protein [Saprospiraceae bacterium]MBP7699727.1 enoyl-CoA hydratase/isomerase family protein [Saprospiraceae bacterium]